MAVAVQGAGQRGGVAPEVGGAFDLGAGLGDGLAGLQRLGQGDAVAVAVDEVGDPEQERGAGLAGKLGPAAVVEGGAGGGDGGLGLWRAAFRGDGDEGPVGGGAALEGGAVGAVAPAAVDEVAAAEGGPGGGGARRSG